MMVKFLIPIFFLLVFKPIFAQQAEIKIEADQLLQAMVDEKKIAGLTAGYSIGGDIVWKNSAGFSSVEDEIPFCDSTLTRIASVTKCMTAVAIMQLVEKEMVALDIPIQIYIPDFPKKKEGDITVRHLLSHTSGMTAYQSDESETKQNYKNLEDAMSVFKDRELKFKPGTNFYYTTYGYVVLGRIVEVVSGLSFEEYLQKNIWDKAGMTHTGIEKSSVNYPNKSILYYKTNKKAKKADTNNLSNRIPGGGVYSTLNDVLKFGNAVINFTLIKESTLNLMLENQFVPKEGNPYGLGWFFYAPHPNENLVIGHSGEQTGAATQIMLIPKSNTVVVVLANTSGTWKDVVGLSSSLIGISEKYK